MQSVKKINEDLFWVGVNDRKISLFENVYPVDRGMSYNSYILLDEKTVLFDTVDSVASLQFLENVEHVLGGRALDYLIVNHMEPDHCANIGAIVEKYPSVKIVGNLKTFVMMSQFFDFDVASRKIEVKEGDTLNVGRHRNSYLTIFYGSYGTLAGGYGYLRYYRQGAFLCRRIRFFWSYER